MEVKVLSGNLCGVTSVRAHHRVPRALVLVGLKSLLDKLPATELAEHRPFVALVPHVVGQEAALEPGTTFILTPHDLRYALTSVLLFIDISWEFFGTKFTHHLSPATGKFQVVLQV